MPTYTWDYEYGWYEYEYDSQRYPTPYASEGTYTLGISTTPQMFKAHLKQSNVVPSRKCMYNCLCNLHL